MKPKQAFTLLELLVVIAIIAILAGLLLAALGRAKATAKQSKCLSNMKQAVLAMLMYASDNEDTIPFSEYWWISRNGSSYERDAAEMMQDRLRAMVQDRCRRDQE